MVSFPGALPEERESRALFNSPKVGSLSSSSNSGMHLIAFRASSVTTFSLGYNSDDPAFQLLRPILDEPTCGGLQRGSFLLRLT